MAGKPLPESAFVATDRIAVDPGFRRDDGEGVGGFPKPAKKKTRIAASLQKNGGSGRNRTADTGIFKRWFNAPMAVQSLTNRWRTKIRFPKMPHKTPLVGVACRHHGGG